MILVESVTLCLVAVVLALPLGWLLSAMLVRGSARSFGFGATFVFPWLWVPAIAALAMVVAAVAAALPGRRAARLDVVDALRVE